MKKILIIGLIVSVLLSVIVIAYPYIDNQDGTLTLNIEGRDYLTHNYSSTCISRRCEITSVGEDEVEVCEDTVICTVEEFEANIDLKVADIIERRNPPLQNASFEKLTAHTINADEITDNSPSWNEDQSVSENCLLNTDLSSTENMHNTICPQLTNSDGEIRLNRVVRMLWWFMQKTWNRQQILNDRTEELCSYNPNFSWC
jgi:hypothetical protein